MGEASHGLYRAGEGDPLVLLHGFTGTWRHWRPVLPELVARYEVIAPTLAGHAGGPALDAQLGFQTLDHATDHLERHLDELGVETAHFAGNSMGGALAINLAKRGRVRSVVGLAPAGGWTPGDGETERLRRFFRRQLGLTRVSEGRLEAVMRRPGLRRLALRDVMRHGELVDPRDAADMARASLACTITDDVLAALGRDEGALLDLGQVAAPVLLAWPEHDRILPRATCSDRMRREIPGAEFRVLPGCGHVPMWDDPRLVVQTIEDWVSRHLHAPVAA